MSSPSPRCLYPLKDLDPAHSPFPEPQAALFCSRQWFELLARTAVQGEALLLDNARSGAHFSALAVHRRPERRLGLSFSSIEALSNYYSMYYKVIGSTRTEDLQALAGSIASLPFPVLRLGPFAGEDGTCNALAEALRTNGFSVQVSEAFGNWIEPTQGRAFETYFAARPSALRNTHERKRRALEKQHRWQFRLLEHDDAALEKGIADYLAIYGSSWKPPEQNPGFMPALIRLAARQGQLRLGLVDIDGQAAAAQVWLRDGDTSLIYKLAHHPRFDAFSVGLLLTTELMRHAFDVERVALIAFGSGDDPYKKDWMSQRRSRETLTAYNRRTMLGLLASLKA